MDSRDYSNIGVSGLDDIMEGKERPRKERLSK